MKCDMFPSKFVVGPSEKTATLSVDMSHTCLYEAGRVVKSGRSSASLN